MRTGNCVTVKAEELVPLPKPFVTVMNPVAAPLGTTTVICVALSTVNEAAGVPLKTTPEILTKFDPVKTTEEPTEALVVLKEAITGEPFPESTVKTTGAETPTAPSLSVARAVML
jgi:hypothetical protein